MSNELYKKYRPQTLEDVVGQVESVRVLSGMIQKKRVPHTMLFSGPSGCGKTTLARIMADKIGCGDADLAEINCAAETGIDLPRAIGSKMSMAPISGRCRVWILDECHQLTKPAQSAFLKLLEDTPKHVYFFLATTDPGKLLPTIKTRSTEVVVKPIQDAGAKEMITRVLTAEGKKALAADVVDALVAAADGSARKILVLLAAVLAIDDEEGQLDAITAASGEVPAFNLCRELLNPRATWGSVAAILKAIDGEDPEGIRRMVCAYMSNVLRSGKENKRAANVLYHFVHNFFDTGKPQLTLACYSVFYG